MNQPKNDADSGEIVAIPKGELKAIIDRIDGLVKICQEKRKT